MPSIGLIPRRRLYWIPPEYHFHHEYCYFLHDECARLLQEYEDAEAHVVNISFADKQEAESFEALANSDPIQAMRVMGYSGEARSVILNTVKMAMVVDCLHHIYEGFRCLEKRKFTVAFNLLRKPLMDSLVYFSWILGDELGFYEVFSAGNPDLLTNKRIGNIRRDILEKAINQTGASKAVDSNLIHDIFFDPKNEDGLFGLFQHAVHLITVGRPEIQTTPENFNFIFKDPFDDDVFEIAYSTLPIVMLFLANVVLEMFDRIKPMEGRAKSAFAVRSNLGFKLTGDDQNIKEVQNILSAALSPNFKCKSCSTPFVATKYNSMRVALVESYRCTRCRRINHLPLSYLFAH